MTAATSVFAARPGDIAFGESTLNRLKQLGPSENSFAAEKLMVLSPNSARRS
jgi:hypothetical protein